MHFPRRHLAVAVVNELIYAIGGYGISVAGSVLSRVEAYDPTADPLGTGSRLRLQSYIRSF